MTNKENYLRNVTFNNPEWMPILTAVTFASLIQHKGEMESVMARFPEYFPYAAPGKIDYSIYGDGSRDEIEDDAWGYQWHYTRHGLEGSVINHPIDDWSKFDSYKAPDSNIWHDRGGKRNWEIEIKNIKEAREKG